MHPRNPMPAMDYKVVNDYLTTTLANPDARTTGNIMATLSADLAPLMTGQLRELFNTGLNITPGARDRRRGDHRPRFPG